MSMTDEERANIKALVRGAYDIQEIRMQMGARLVSNLKVKLGIAPGTKEDKADRDAQKILKDLKRDHALITRGASKISMRNFKAKGLIDNYAVFALVEGFQSFMAQEEAYMKNMGKVVQETDLWKGFFEGVRGVGPTMAGVIISEIDIEKATYPSSLHMYAGLDVAQDGKGRSRRKEHQIDREYKDKEGKDQTRKSITFNPFLKTKLTGVLGGSFLKAGGKYADIYYNYKNRIENMPPHAGKTKAHRHNMAIRYATKRFLVDLHIAWRTMEGLPVSEPYSVAKLNIRHREAG